METCPKHEEIATSLARIEERLIGVDRRINGSIHDIEKHIEHGKSWRIAIVGVAATFLTSLFLQVGAFLYLWGGLNKQVEINTQRWEKVEALTPVAIIKK